MIKYLTYRDNRLAIEATRKIEGDEVKNDPNSTELASPRLLGVVRQVGGGCSCRKCLGDKPYPGTALPIADMVMIVCEICGNKRCPHATDCSLECTGSNEPGQRGSVYE